MSHLFTPEHVSVAQAFVIEDPKSRGIRPKTAFGKVVCFTGLEGLDFQSPEVLHINGQPYARGAAITLTQIFSAQVGGLCCAREYHPRTALAITPRR